MTSSIQQRLDALGITLDAPPAAVANYVPYVLDDKMLIISGQIPISEGSVQYKGKVGSDVDIDDAQAAARLCAINILTQAQAAIGDLDRIERLVRLGGFVAAAPDFYDHALVINGASDFMVDVLGDRGKHARAAVGCSSLPLNSAVEVEAMFRVSSWV
jgi:enamine deaminase RidA (YjgF/YER057c/UK114 family)